MTTIAPQQNSTSFAAVAVWGTTGTNPSCGCAPSNPTNASTKMEGGKVCFENDNYRITAGDNNEVTIHNKHTGETYQVWGDPHVNVDGQHAFDFKGTTTFQLDDGTKVTIQTAPYAPNPGTTLASKVTITNGDYGVQISGVDTNKVGDLKFEETQHFGSALDRMVADGTRLHENPAGKGFLGIDGEGRIRPVDQKFIDQAERQRGSDLQERFQDMLKTMAGLMAITFVGGFLAGLAAAAQSSGPEPRPQPEPGTGGCDDASGGWMLVMTKQNPNMSWFMVAGGSWNV